VVVSYTGRLRDVTIFDSCPLVSCPSSCDAGTRIVSPVSRSSSKSYPKPPTKINRRVAQHPRRLEPPDLLLPYLYEKLGLSLAEKDIVWLLNASGFGILGNVLTFIRSPDFIHRLMRRSEKRPVSACLKCGEVPA
jgi:hypothetical protein